MTPFPAYSVVFDKTLQVTLGPESEGSECEL